MTISVSSAKIYRILQFLILVAILGLLVWSKPWDTSSSTADRTITVKGEATLKAVPDEFTFNPYFQETGEDQEVLKESLTTKADAAVTKLKELGVKEENITLDASSYDRWYYREDGTGTLTVSLTIVVPAGDVVQDVQDYLLTLDVKGQISPMASFSDAKQKELDAQAVEEASKDAKSKAEAQANLFNAKLGDVIKVEQDYDSIFYGYRTDASLSFAEDSVENASLPVLPGQDEYTQTVTVVYELR